MKLGSLFDGSGGFPLAGALCGITPVWASEVEPYPIAVTRSRFPSMRHLGDVSKVSGADIEPVDIITFGSPCQDLSVAGKRAGLKHTENGDEETTRSGLFMEAVRIIKEMREKTGGKYPTFAVWENVPGAFSSNKGEDFKTVLEELIRVAEPEAPPLPAPGKNGWPYADCIVGDGWSVAWRVFDAQYWGVPQRRRRIYLVADFGGERAGKILFEREGLRGYFAEDRTPWQGTPAHAGGSPAAADREGELIPYTLKIRSGCEGGGKGALIQENKSAILATNNDQYLFVPVAYSKLNEEPDELILNDQGGQQLSVEFGVCPTLRAEAHENLPCALHASGFKAGQGAQARSIGWEMEKAPTLAAEAGGNSVPSVCAVYRKGTRPHSADEAQKWEETDVANTINTFDVGEARANELVVMCYDARGNGDGKTAPTITGDHNNRVTDYTAVLCMATQQGGAEIMENICPTITAASGMSGNNQPVICLQGNGIDRADTAGCNGKDWKEDICYTLNTIDRPAVVYSIGNGQPNSLRMEEIAKPLDCMHDAQAVVTECLTPWDNQARRVYDADGVFPALAAREKAGQNQQAVLVRYIVRRLTPTECARLQGFADRWGVLDHKDDFTDAECKFWQEVRDTYAEISGKAKKQYTKAQLLNWYNGLYTDSAEYKMWGNGIALPTALYVMQGIEEAFRED